MTVGDALIYFACWYFTSIVFLLGALVYCVRKDIKDHVTLEDVYMGSLISLLGPIVPLYVAIYHIKEALENRANIVLWSSKSYKARKVLGLDKQNVR